MYVSSQQFVVANIIFICPDAAFPLRFTFPVPGGDYSYVDDCVDRINAAWNRTNLEMASDLSNDGADAYSKMCNLFKSKGARLVQLSYFYYFAIP